MSPSQRQMLVRQIIPRIASALPVAVSHVGSEDTPELIQDGTPLPAPPVKRVPRPLPVSPSAS